MLKGTVGASDGEKPQSLRELVAIVEQYLTAHNKKLPSRDFNAKKGVGAPRPESKNADVFPTTTGSIKCFRKVRHKAGECFLRVQERNLRKNFCYRCGELGHTFLQCEKGNPLARGSAGAREKGV